MTKRSKKKITGGNKSPVIKYRSIKTSRFTTRENLSAELKEIGLDIKLIDAVNRLDQKQAYSLGEKTLYTNPKRIIERIESITGTSIKSDSIELLDEADNQILYLKRLKRERQGIYIYYNGSRISNDNAALEISKIQASFAFRWIQILFIVSKTKKTVKFSFNYDECKQNEENQFAKSEIIDSNGNRYAFSS